ncbi:MAG TPA: tRNA lysidine(34) synthetase TilS [Gallionella sp.]|nr:tRNA lysidine(34) synthetase TilS [Gallionella sp.]
MVHSRNKLSEELSTQLAPLVPAHGSILIGLSGGVDSVVLLHLLHRLAPRFSWRLSALHVHHGISPNADAWADFCAGLCAQHAIPLHIENVDITPLREHGIEAAARKLRHAAFARQTCDFVALAHHADDQAETLLLQLLRGAGVRGASAMPVLSQVEGPLLAERKSSGIEFSPLRPELVEGHGVAMAKWVSTGSARTEPKNICAGSIVRPLLHCSRKDILDYATAENLQWIEDESNADDSYPRNFLRHRVLPLLEQKFPACRNTLARSARHFAETSELLDDLARLDAQNPSPLPSGGEITSDLAVDVGQPSRMASGSIRARERGEGHDTTLEVSRLQSLSRPRAKNLLRWFLHSVGAPMPQAVQLDDMLHQLCDARQDAAVCIAYGAHEVRRYQGRVYALRAPGEFDRNLVLPWQGEAGLDWHALNARLIFEHTQGRGISLAKLQHAPVMLRLRQGGETLRPYPNAATRTLKNLLQEHHVPPWQRDRLPLLYCGDELVCAVGVASAAEYQASAGEAGISLGLLPWAVNVGRQ